MQFVPWRHRLIMSESSGLIVPAMKYEPQAPQFTEYLIILPKVIEDNKANRSILFLLANE